MPSSPVRHSAVEVFLVFLRWGCLAFGGPVAHVGYFQEEFVRRRRWLTESEYADLLALCQFLPGPASSQLGFAIGYRRAGFAGAFAAWTGFTLPSAVLMIAFAYGLGRWGDPTGGGWVTGLKLAAVAVVAKAVWDLGTKLCPDLSRIFFAGGVTVFLLFMENPFWQLAAIAAGAAFGLLFLRERLSPARKPSVEPRGERAGRRTGALLLGLFFLLLAGLPLVAATFDSGAFALADAFYRAGALVFGGGHVVLPLLDAYTVQPGWIDRETFLAGYGAAQALPGPLFAFSAFLGVVLTIGPGGVLGGFLALFAIYVPSWLLVLGTLPFWQTLRHRPGARAALAGTNAAVVGLLLAAWIHPVGTAAITGPWSALFALVAFVLLRWTKLPPWALVLLGALAGAVAF